MSLEFFRPRDRFDFSKDSLDIGKPFLWDRESFLKHFFLRIFAIGNHRWEEFYRHHLTYYMSNHPDGSEEIFFKKLWLLIETRLKSLVLKDIYVSKTHVRDQKEIEHLKSFTGFLTAIDKWNCHETDKAAVVRLQTELYSALDQIKNQKAELKEAKKLETTDHINIPKGYLLTVVDLFIELQKQTVDDKVELVFSRTQAIWMKMICRYFTEDHQAIKYDRLKRYFSPDPDDLSKVKFAEVPDNKKLFKIVPTNKRS